MNLAAVYEPVFAAVPDRPALVVDGGTVTYGELGTAVRAAAAALAFSGTEPGQRIALVDEPGLLTVATVLAAARLGAAAAPMNHRLTPREMRELHRVAGCCPVAVAGSAALETVGEAFGHSPLTERLLLAWTPDTEPAAEVSPGDDALVLFTSGTTGTPKAVPLSHADLVPQVQFFAQAFDPQRPPVVSLQCLPLVHVGGLVGLLVALASGSTTVLMRRFDAGEWLRLAAEHRVERTFLVPALLRRLLDHPDFPGTDLSALRSLAYGAAPAPPDLVARAVEALPHVAFTNVFGQTETVGAVTMLGPDDHRHPSRIGSVGRPLPGVEIEVDPGTGELLVRREGHDGWHRTGDLVRVDDDGYLWPVGRLSDVVNRGGEKVSPQEVEEVLRSHPEVDDVAVAAVPDEELGERIGAAVVLAPGAQAGPAELVDWCRGQLAPFKVPDRVTLVDAIPYTDLGKVRRADVAGLVVGS